MPPFRLVIYGSLPTISRVGPGQCIRPLCRAQARDSFDFILLSRNCGCQGETCSTHNLSRVVDPTCLQSVGGDCYHSSKLLANLGWNPANPSMLAHVFRLSRSLNVFHVSRVSVIPFIRLAPLTVSLYTFILVIPFILCIPFVPFITCIPFIPLLPFIPFIQSKPFISFVPSVSVIKFIP